MSDDRPIRRPEEPAPTADPAGVGEPAVVRSQEEVRVAAVPHAPAADADDSGPAHRADGPALASSSGDEGSRPAEHARESAEDSRVPQTVGDHPESEDRIGGPAAAVPAETGLDPRPEGGGWVTAEPPAIAEDGGRPVTVAGPDSAAADSIDRPDPGADLIPDALPPVDARHDSGSHDPDHRDGDRDGDSRRSAVAPHRVDEGGVGHPPESELIAEEARELPEDRPLSPAEQPTTEAPRIAAARAEALRAQNGPAADAAARSESAPGITDERATGTSIHEPRPEEARGVAPVAAPAVAAAMAPPVPSPTTPVQQTGEQPVAAPPAQRPVYVESPLPPKKKGNRGFGILMSLLAALVYALVWAGVAALIIALNTAGDRVPQSLTTFLASPVYWGPVLVFALGMIVLSLLVNRGGWAWWLIGGFLVAVAVYFGYLGSALLTVARQLTPNDVAGFVGSIAVSPLAIASAVIAREVSIWFGLATSARGKKVKARNAEARQNFDREQAERRAQYDSARAGIADDRQG